MAERYKKKSLEYFSGYTLTDDTGTEEQVAALDFSAAFRTTNLGKALCVKNPLQQKFTENYCASLNREKIRKDAYLHHYQRDFFINQVFTKGFNPYLKPAETLCEPCLANESSIGSLSTVGETHSATTTSATELAARNRRAFPFVRSQTIAELGRKRPNRHPQENSQLPAVFETELKLSEKSKTSLQLNDSKVHFSENFPEIAKHAELSLAENAGSRNSDFKRKPHSRQRSDDNFVRKITVKQHSTANKPPMMERQKSESALRDIAVLRRHPELLFPKMNALRESFNPLEPEDIIQLGKKELKDTQNDALNKSFMDQSASRKDIRKSPGKEKRENELQNRNAENFSETMVIDLERKKDEQLKMIERLSCSLPQKLEETARDQIRQMTNADAICEWKEKTLLEHREIQHEDRKKDPRWRKLESSLCDTHGVGKQWQKVCSKKLWMLL